MPAALHGAVYAGAWFGDGGPSWSRDEERVAYVAERPERETTPEWGREDFVFAGGEGVDSDRSGGGGALSAQPESSSSSKNALPLPKPWRGLGAKFEDWGEQLTGKARPSVFVLDVQSATVLAVAPPPTSEGDDEDDEEDSSSSSQGQPALSPCGRAVVFASWPHRDENLYPGLGRQRLGMVYCTNRPCSLWLARLPEVGAGGEEDGGGGGKAPPPPLSQSPPPPPRCLTPELLSAMSPRFSPRGDRLAFLSHDAAVSSGAHFATAALLCLDFDPGAAEPATKSPRVVVPVVARPRSPDHFPGIYAASLPDRPYVTESVLALTSQWRSSTEVLLVDLGSGEVACASKPGSPETGGGTRRRSAEKSSAGDSSSSFEGSWAFLAALPPSISSTSKNSGGGGWLAAVVSSPTCPPDVVVADFSAAAAEAAAGGAAPAPVAAVAARLRWRRAARADGSPPPLRAPAAAAMARVTTRVIEVAVAAAGPRPRPRGEEEEDEEEEDGEGEEEEEEDVDNVIEVIVVSPSSSSPSSSGNALPPALVVPHGGPHSAHADGWALPTSFLAACGFCVLLVNFRGSTVRVFFFSFFDLSQRVAMRVSPKNKNSRTRSLSFSLLSLPPKSKQGRGESTLQLLPGRIGSLDVGDCVAALRAAADLGLADASRAAAVGGSHGGFLAANLLGMHPALFKAGVLRNPVLVRVCVSVSRRRLFVCFRRSFSVCLHVCRKNVQNSLSFLLPLSSLSLSTPPGPEPHGRRVRHPGVGLRRGLGRRDRPPARARAAWRGGPRALRGGVADSARRQGHGAAAGAARREGPARAARGRVEVPLRAPREEEQRRAAAAAAEREEGERRGAAAAAAAAEDEGFGLSQRRARARRAADGVRGVAERRGVAQGARRLRRRSLSRARERYPFLLLYCFFFKREEVVTK